MKRADARVDRSPVKTSVPRTRGRSPLTHREQHQPMITTTYEFIATWLRARFEDEKGSSLVEYALLVALIAVVCIGAITFLGNSASTKFQNVGNSLAN